MGKPPPYYLRLRIFAKQAAYFYQKLRLLEPIYDNCPVRCLAPEKDKANGCPECSYTIYFKQLKDGYYRILTKDLQELLELSGIEKDRAKKEAEKMSLEDWTFEEMQADYRALTELESFAGVETAEHPGGRNPGWTLRTDLAISIIREERYKVRRELDYKREQEAEAERKAREARGRGRV